jgi:competence protein ComEC
MMLGAAWIALWRLPWRWLGLVPFGLGLALMGARKPPDILVGRDGQAVAIRLESGRLSALPGRGVAFELQRWLEHDGDARGLKEAGAGQGFRCDALGCTASVKGRQLAVVAHPAALADDCARALIVIVRFPRPRGCGRPQLVIDLSKVRAEGVHLIWLEEDRIGVATVAGHRGVRPWTGARPALQRRRPLERPAIEAAGPLRPQVPRAGEHGRPGFEGDHAPPDEPEVEEP